MLLGTTHPFGLLVLLGLIGYALYRQTVTTVVTAAGRFRMPLVYLAVGVALSGTDWPTSAAGWTVLAIGLALSLVVGAVRGFATRIWFDRARGVVLRRGTAFTITLYVVLIATKVALSVVAARSGIHEGSSVGQILAVVGASLLLQAQIVFVRAAARAHASPV